jgi:hypothetical protein
MWTRKRGCMLIQCQEARHPKLKPPPGAFQHDERPPFLTLPLQTARGQWFGWGVTVLVHRDKSVFPTGVSVLAVLAMRKLAW